MLKWNSKKLKLSELKEYEFNPRTIKPKQLVKLVEYIKEDGYHQRILVNYDHTIIGGHQRKKAMLQAGYAMEEEIDVLVPDRLLTQQELDRINIRDNLAFGEFDFDILGDRFNVDELVEFGMPDDLLVGFGDDDLLAEEDAGSEELQEEPKAKLGDVYILGNHRLMCGDSTNPQHVDKLLNEAKPILMVTDPPYGVNYKPEWREEAGKGVRNTGKVLNDDRYDWSEAYSLFTGDVAYVWHSSLYTHKFAENIENCGFDLISLIIWSKQNMVLSRGDYHNKHEPLWYAVRKGQKITHNWQGRRDQTTVWEIENNNPIGGVKTEEPTGHGTQKPLECMMRPILNNSKKGQSVYDPFGGSGTTLIACEKSKRNCYMMELSPVYIDMIIRRWEKESGQDAVLDNIHTPETL
jgi:site-specific DNA-methyltransferase (adenine-specific)